MLEFLLAPFLALFWLLIKFIAVLLVLCTILWGAGKALLWLLLGMNPKLHRKVAVFGESGSGKTMLLTSFYGHQQAARFKKANGYWVVAGKPDQGTALLSAYYRLESDLLPPGDRFNYNAYDFDFNIEGIPTSLGLITWYDYPGGWWTEGHYDDEQRRKEELVSQLVQSDVGLLLVDGQKFHKHGGNYLRRLFASFRDELARQHRLPLRLPSNSPGKPSHGERMLNTFDAGIRSVRRQLVQYPSIWVVCLSKADLFEEYSAEEFRKDVLKHGAEEINALHAQLESMTRKPELVSIGEEFLLLSCAEFDEDNLHVKDPTKTVGIDLIAPIALMAPPQHAYRLIHKQHLRAGTVKRSLTAVRSATVGWMKCLPLIGNIFMAVDDQMAAMVKDLEQLEARKQAQASVLAMIVETMHARLTQNDAVRVYCGVNSRRNKKWEGCG